MSDTFYAVQYVINGRCGTLPSTFQSKSDAIEFATKLRGMSDERDSVKTEVRLYEVKEIKF